MDQLRIITEAALTAAWNDTAYHCTRHGLQAERMHRAHFLFLRGQCLPIFAVDRRQDCLDAAIHLARATRQMDLVAVIVDYRKDDAGSYLRGPFGLSDSGDLDLTEEELDDIVKTELREKKYPTYVSPMLDRYGRTGECQCPKCRRKRKTAQREAPEPAPKPKKPKPEPDPQMLLFDDLYNEEDRPLTDAEDSSEEAGRIDIETGDTMAGMPADVLEVLSELSALNNDEPPTESDLERILQESPEMQDKLYETLLENMMNGGLTPDMLGFDPPEPLPRRRNRKKRKR